MSDHNDPETHGYKYLTASNGETAIMMTTSHNPDIMLLDLGLPDIDGTVTQKYFHLPDYVCAPVQQGDVVGTVELKLAGETIGMVNLIAGQDVSRSSLLYSFSKLQEFFGSLYLKVVLVVSAICAIIYVAWVLLNSPHTRHSSKKVHRYGRPRD